MYDTQALALWRKVKDRRGESLALMTVGWASTRSRSWDKALVSELVALALAKQADDPEIEGGIETALMIGFRDQHHPEEAIFFGMEAVSAFQTIRKNISEMDKDLQAGFAQSKSMTYRILAELLIETGRLGEAEQILDLLKEQELKDVVRGTAPDAAPEIRTIQLDCGAAASAERDGGVAKSRRWLSNQQSVEAAGLRRENYRSRRGRCPPERAGRQALEKSNLAILAGFAGSVYGTLEQPIVAAAGSQRPRPRKATCKTRWPSSGPACIGIRLLVGDDHVYEIVVTANTRKKIELSTTPADLRRQGDGDAKSSCPAQSRIPGRSSPSSTR